jgi:hypothetical protein
LEKFPLPPAALADGFFLSVESADFLLDLSGQIPINDGVAPETSKIRAAGQFLRINVLLTNNLNQLRDAPP